MMSVGCFHFVPGAGEEWQELARRVVIPDACDAKLLEINLAAGSGRAMIA